METALWIAATVGPVATFPVLRHLRSLTRGTTLTGAWNWAALAACAWLVSWLADFSLGSDYRGLLDRCWYFTAILAVCPWIAVLGSRRPVSRVWTFFVVLPLVVVLGVPLATTWQDGLSPPPLRLESPAVIGFALVSLMGIGNYVGTRFTGAALLFAAAVALLLVPLCGEGFACLDAGLLRAAAAIALGLAAAWADWTRNRPSAASARGDTDTLQRFDGVWVDFRDFFGVVWAGRVQHRLNEFARRERWPAHFESDRIVRDRESDDDEKYLQRIEQTLRWVLKRFVDPEWIDCRLQTGRLS